MPATLSPPYRTLPRGLHGTNLVPEESQQGGYYVWGTMWGPEWDFSLLQEQINKAVTLGCNSVRLQGDVGAVTRGDITLGTYLARQAQVLRYCEARGLWYYTTVSGHFDLIQGYDADDMIPVGVPLARMLAQARNVFGLDLIQEYHLGPDGVDHAADVLAVAAAVRAVAPGLALTNSVVPSNGGDWNSSKWTAVAEVKDFHDAHIYYDASAGDADDLPADGLPRITGEIGQNQAAGEPAIRSRYQGGAALEGRADWYGSYQWAIVRYNTGENDWGAYDTDGTPRTPTIEEFTDYPLTGTSIPIPAVRVG